jgi:hypothetical protein
VVEVLRDGEANTLQLTDPLVTKEKVLKNYARRASPCLSGSFEFCV